MLKQKKLYDQKQSKKRIPLLVAAIVMVIAASIVILELTDTTHFLHKQKPAPTASSETKGEVNNPNNSQSTGNEASGDISPVPNDQKGEAGNQSSGALLIEPTGNFVSNHHPNLGGSPAPNNLQSTCNTTPAASCSITFTKDGVTKSLDAQTTDRGGAAYWSWKLQDIGITEGSWKVQAIATLSGQTRSVGDALNLEVSK